MTNRKPVSKEGIAPLVVIPAVAIQSSKNLTAHLIVLDSWEVRVPIRVAFSNKFTS